MGLVKEEIKETKEPEMVNGQAQWPVEVIVKPMGHEPIKKKEVATSKNKAKSAAKFAVLGTILASAITITVSVISKIKIQK